MLVNKQNNINKIFTIIIITSLFTDIFTTFKIFLTKYISVLYTIISNKFNIFWLKLFCFKTP